MGNPYFLAQMFCLPFSFGFVKSQFFGLLTGVGQKFFCRELKKKKIERKRIEEKSDFQAWCSSDQLFDRRSIRGSIELIFGQQLGDKVFLTLYGRIFHPSLVASEIPIFQQLRFW